MNILALDLGTKCGWAINPDIMNCGEWDLKPKTTESAGERYRKFQLHLAETFSNYRITQVVYEEVHAHAAIEAAHVFGGLQAILQTICIQSRIEYKGVGVGAIKKHATKKGNAKKDDMICAAALKWPHINISSDNLADALWLLDYAQTHFTIR